MNKAQLIGINHIALEVGSLAEALALYEQLFSFEYRAKGSKMAFLDMGDQFIAVIGNRTQPPDDERHFGLVVDDIGAVEAALQETGTGYRASPKGVSMSRIPGGITSRSSTTAKSVRTDRRGQAQARCLRPGEDRPGAEGDRRSRFGGESVGALYR